MAYPQFKSLKLSIRNRDRILDPKKTIADYGIGYQTNNVQVEVVGIPGYMLGAEGVIKLMKINGSWVYNNDMAKALKL